MIKSGIKRGPHKESDTGFLFSTFNHTRFQLTPNPRVDAPQHFGQFQRMILETIPDLNRMSAAEKLLLVSELWDDLAAHPTEVPVSREQIAELDRRVQEYRRDPSKVTSWEAIQRRILGKTLDDE